MRDVRRGPRDNRGNLITQMVEGGDDKGAEKVAVEDVEEMVAAVTFHVDGASATAKIECGLVTEDAGKKTLGDWAAEHNGWREKQEAARAAAASAARAAALGVKPPAKNAASASARTKNIAKVAKGSADLGFDLSDFNDIVKEMDADSDAIMFYYRDTARDKDDKNAILLGGVYNGERDAFENTVWATFDSLTVYDGRALSDAEMATIAHELPCAVRRCRLTSG